MNMQIKKQVHIATISGGKDSTVMCDLLLKGGYPVDYIVFNDTLLEYDEMYQYIDKVDSYFTQRYGISITRLKPKRTPEEIMFRKVTKKDSEYFGQVKGVFAPVMGFCEWRTHSKIRPLEEWLKNNNIENPYIYIGITLDEQNRISDADSRQLYPLVTDFKLKEVNCQEYLINQEMENPLYKHFTRTGCSMCPAKSKRDWFNTWKYYPNTWEYMKSIESHLERLEKRGETVIYKSFFPDGRKCLDYEKEFIKSDMQGSLFDFSDEPLKDCFCKI